MSNSHARRQMRLITASTLFAMLCILNISAAAATAQTEITTTGTEPITTMVVYDEELEEEIELMLLAPAKHHDEEEEAQPAPEQPATTAVNGEKLEKQKPFVAALAAAGRHIRWWRSSVQELLRG